MENNENTENNPNDDGAGEDLELAQIQNAAEERRKHREQMMDKALQLLVHIQNLHRYFCHKVVSNPDSSLADIRRAKRTLRILIQELELLKPIMDALMMLL